jgi:EmrB/QacA subfamily drug resistance transporter
MRAITRNRTRARGADTSREPNKWLVLTLVAVAQFMVVLDATIVNVALPAIQTDLGFAQADLQWVITAYTLAFGGFLLLGGRAGDLFGRKRLFLAGVALFTAASAVNGLASSPGILVAGRVAQGLGAALLAPAVLSIITTTFTEASERAKALGVYSAISAGGAAFGLLAGGALTEGASWPWIFFVNLPIGVATILLAVRLVPESRAETRQRLDLAGAASVTAGLTLLVYTIVKAESWGWAATNTLALAAVAIGLLVAFALIEQRSAAPLVRLSILRNRALTGANAVIMLAFAAMFAMFFFLSIYAQEILGYGALTAGLAFLPLSAGIVAGAGLAQQLIGRLGLRAVPLAGMVMSAVGMLLLADIPVDGDYVTDLLPGLVLASVGIGLTFMPMTLLATATVEESEAGVASGLLNTAQQIGGALGLAVLSTLAADQTTSTLDGLGRAPSAADQASALVDGFQVALLTAGGLMLAGALLIAALLRRRHVQGVDLTEPVAVGA